MAKDNDNSTGGVWQASSPQLARLLALAANANRAWKPDELRAIWTAQMDATLPCDLGGFPDDLTHRIKRQAADQGLLLRSCGALLQHPQPPLDLLRLVKDFAKANVGHPESHLPESVARTLYYAVVATARLKLDQRLTELEDTALASGLRWALTQDWLDESTRQLFEDTLSRLVDEPLAD